jgi:hypothetical protein
MLAQASREGRQHVRGGVDQRDPGLFGVDGMELWV